MERPPDYYLLLGISPDAGAAEVRTAFATAIKKCHPDMVHSENGDRARMLIEARDTLIDPVRRRAYDEERQRGGSLVRSTRRGAPQWIFVCSHGMGQFRTIREALDAAVDGDKIYVLPGTYKESLIAVEKTQSIESGFRSARR